MIVKKQQNILRFIAPLITLALTACTGKTTSAPPDTVTPVAQSWGTLELTNAAYTSSMADKPCPAESESVKYIDPLPYIIEHAKRHKIVMINESHYKPLHRVFIGEVAAALKPHGYEHYGAEALSSPDSPETRENAALAERGYPIGTDGTYLREPVFGQTVERILGLGYTSFGYERQTEPPPSALSRIDHRDSEQAKNILKKMRSNPNGKFLIHAGYEHIRENEDDGYATTWMARFFKQKSGIDPFTINQAWCYSDDAFDGGELGYALAVDVEGNPLNYPGFDLLIIPPREAQYNERPLWLRDALGRKFTDVPDSLIFDDQYTRITAFNTTRVENAVAEDTIYRAPQSRKLLALRPGQYRVEARGKDKVLLGEDNLTVTE